MIIDTEVRIVHKKARYKNYCKSKNDKKHLDIYSHKSIHKGIKLWGIETLIKSMKKNNVSKALISGLAWNNSKDQNENNLYVEQNIKKFKNYLKGFYIADLNNIEDTVKKIQNLDKNLYAGVEIIPKWQNTNINDQKILPIIKQVQKKNLFLKVYTAHFTQTLNGDAPFRTLEFIKKYPNLKIIVPHLGSLLPIYCLEKKIKKILKKTYFITSVSSTMKMIEFAAQINDNNLLFGTDFPFNHCFNQNLPIKKLKELKISKCSKRKILYDNANNLFFRKK